MDGLTAFLIIIFALFCLFCKYREVILVKIINPIVARANGIWLVPWRNHLFLTLPDAVRDLVPPGEKVKILEIGIGDGSNFTHYPKGPVALTAEDVNDNFEKELRNKIKHHPNITLEKYLLCSAEDMKALASESFHIVICTHVICSVGSPENVIREVKRLLVKGGYFFIMEHIAYHKSSWQYWLQFFVNPFWQFVMCGCRLTRKTDVLMQNSNFDRVNNTVVVIEKMLLLIRPQLVGVAIK